MTKRNEAEEINFRLFAAHKKGIDFAAVVKDAFDPCGFGLITREQVDGSNWLIEEAKRKGEEEQKEEGKTAHQCSSSVAPLACPCPCCITGTTPIFTSSAVQIWGVASLILYAE